jgi:hypothetical protein
MKNLVRINSMRSRYSCYRCSRSQRLFHYSPTLGDTPSSSLRLRHNRSTRQYCAHHSRSGTLHRSPRGHVYTCPDSEHLLLSIYFPDGQTVRLPGLSPNESWKCLTLPTLGLERNNHFSALDAVQSAASLGAYIKNACIKSSLDIVHFNRASTSGRFGGYGNLTVSAFEIVEGHLSILADLDERAVRITHLAAPFPAAIV